MASDTALFRLLPRKTTLRMRVTLCCAALGGVIGVGMAYVADRISERDERVLVNDEMDAEMNVQIAQHRGDADDAHLPRSLWKSLYIDRPGKPPTSPVATRSLSPGVHELDAVIDGNDDRFAAIRITPIGRIAMVVALPNSPAREKRFTEELVAMILLGIVLGTWLGRMLASGMLSPVLRLCDQVDRADPTTELRDIAEDHRTDEVGALANAFIRYHGRMQTAVEREMLFSADASHELRTPLSVLQGALDLLREGQGSAASGQRRVERIRRSATEIGMLLDALLLIARSDETQDPSSSAIDIGAALAAVIAEYRNELDAAQVEVGVRCAHGAGIQAPPELLRTALRLLFRAIASGVWGNRLRLDADAHGIVLSSADAPGSEDAAADTPDTALPGDAESVAAPRRSDESGGIGMLRRLCERYGWALKSANDPAQSILLRLRMVRPDERPQKDATI
ncbi:MAG TPA: HAMP domain-containing sensor histidine kinase [Xanthomonadaceae bacterium]|jgi:signal transduction histidine kinase|nr:HAMP domain-containing sensor histidine kinase [Xanthomonadaceae bacterium]